MYIFKKDRHKINIKNKPARLIFSQYHQTEYNMAMSMCKETTNKTYKKQGKSPKCSKI